MASMSVHEGGVACCVPVRVKRVWPVCLQLLQCDSFCIRLIEGGVASVCQ